MKVGTVLHSLAGLLLLSFAVACGGSSDSEAIKLTSSIYVNAVDATPLKLSVPASARPAPGDGVEPEQVLSVTPSSYKVQVDWIQLGESWEEVDGSGPVCTGKLIQIDVNQTLDLASNTFQKVFESTLELTTEQLGQYRCVHLNIGGTADINWTATVNGKSYDFSEPAATQNIELGWGGRIVAFPEGVVVDITDAEPLDADAGTVVTGTYTAGIVLDLSNALVLWRRAQGPGDVIVEDLSPPEDPGSDVVAVLSGTPIILPFFGSQQPIMERFELSFAAAEKAKLGLQAEQSLAMTFNAVLNDSMQLMVVGWNPRYGDATASVPLAFEPADAQLQRISANGDGSYKIEDINSDVVVRDRALHFPAFRLENHTGTFDYGDDANIVLEYTATKK
jgi:hypothetical protein